MSTLTSTQLKDIDTEDISDVLQRVEKSFGFQFGDTELKDVKTFGELCDIVASRVQGENSDDCTTQQAFYKVREAIAQTLIIDKSSLTVATRLQELFPKQQRRRRIKAVEKTLGFHTKVLRPKHWITTTLFLLLIASIIGLFLFWQAGLPGLVFSFAGLWISGRLGKELDLNTVGELADRIAREHYKKARRNAVTVNRKEIAQKVKELFITGLGIEEEALKREATFK